MQMILSKITVHGFKSFAKKTELKFDGSITSVVGPNGCGKTNVVDAIRWGLGEQRPSVLRTDRMENIIFGGARSSRPLGMAEVSIHFDNRSHILPIDYNEVVVTRRLYRSGESEYLLNKSPVRLKDISDLLMDTGIGADAYSVIELKMVEDILSEKTEDRRKLLEEAAGVTKYKHRLKAAIRKLESTQGDLLRVNDIIQEVERTVRSLKRQVQKAKRYQSLQEEIKELEIKRGSRLFLDIQNKIKPLKGEIFSLKKKKDGRTTEISKEEADLESLKLQLTEREKALVTIQEELSKTVERIHRREGDIRVGKERIVSLQDRIARHTKEIESLKKRLEDQKIHLDVTTRDRETLQVKITSKGRIFNNKTKELEVFQQGLNLKRLDLNNKKKEIIDCLEEINRLSSEETKIRARNDNFRGRLERLDEEDSAFREAKGLGQTKQKELDKTYDDLSNKKNETLSNRDRITGEEKRNNDDIESLKEQFYKDQGELDLLSGRLSFLQNVLESQEGISDGAKKLIKKKVKGLLGVLADLLETAPEHRNVIETGLGEASRYLLFDEISSASDALKVLKQEGGGKVTMVGLDRVKSIPAFNKRPQLPPKLEVVGWADTLIKCDEKLRPIITYLLRDLLVVKDIERANKVLESFSDGMIRIATLDGELITGWGVLHTSESSGKEVGMIGRRQRIKELEAQIQNLSKEIKQNKKLIVEKEAQRELLLKEINKFEESIAQLDEQIMQIEKQRAKVQFQFERAEEGLQKNGEERGKLLGEIEKGKDGLENIRPQIESFVDKREQIEDLINRMQTEVERLEEDERKMEDEVHKHNLSLVRLKGELQNMDYDIERSQKLLEEIESTISQRSVEIEEAKTAIVKHTEETKKNEEILNKDFTEKDKQDLLRAEREEAYQTMREDLVNKEKEIRVVRRDREEVSEIIHNLEMEISELDHQAESICSRISDNYKIDLKQLSPQEEIDVDAAGAEIEELMLKVKTLGPVNLVALGEYDQEKERLDFLSQQRDDLKSAEETLKETITKINQTARERFDEVFSEVRENFQETFKGFFQGGEADLRLPENEDPLEARIEIYARPAGKQLRDLDLLSGGEKALTAISLLFALYMVKPSPFCILDEIDAPLDDANVERFTRVLSEYAKKTQFIIVTHNKMTMRVAQALYGVTMEEEGVSKIVSVKFEDESTKVA
jgi:chromosome segregation protein